MADKSLLGILSATGGPTGPVSPWKADRSVGNWCADREVGSPVADTTVGPHAADNSISCYIPSFLDTAITRCDTF